MLTHAADQGITDVVNTVHYQHPKVETEDISYNRIKSEVEQLQQELDKNNEWTVTRSSQQIGTRIHLEINLNSRRTCQEVFKKIFDQDGKMVRIPVNLVRNKNEQVNSRIQAQSLLHNLKDLTEIEFDFQNIDFIGPAFADELVRKTKEKNQIADISWINSTKMVDVLMSRAMNRLT